MGLYSKKILLGRGGEVPAKISKAEFGVGVMSFFVENFKPHRMEFCCNGTCCSLEELDHREVSRYMGKVEKSD